MSITVILEATRVKCPSCETLIDTDENEIKKGYTCSSCGTTDEERRCPDCNIFKAKAEYGICPECDEPFEEDPEGLRVPVITCGCHDEEHEVNI